MTYRLKKTVVMVGMMGAGKTAIGTAVARLLDVPFRDSDAEIVAAANLSIAEIFTRYGEPFFRDKERRVIERLLTSEPSILSVGGGAFLSETNRDLIGELGVAVWLRADLELLWSRVKHKDTRPLLRTPDPKATLAALLTERTPFYRQAPVVVDAHADYSIDEMAEKVIGALLAREDVLEKEPV